mmetsp:Transcript_23778/g.94279  ORF Transcript_23778/g.94279 Transcript_23778/m.94279 type:complete len:434 (-) Transcript_23778:344-1645(-)
MSASCLLRRRELHCDTHGRGTPGERRDRGRVYGATATVSPVSSLKPRRRSGLGRAEFAVMRLSIALVTLMFMARRSKCSPNRSSAASSSSSAASSGVVASTRGSLAARARGARPIGASSGSSAKPSRSAGRPPLGGGGGGVVAPAAPVGAECVEGDVLEEVVGREGEADRVAEEVDAAGRAGVGDEVEDDVRDVVVEQLLELERVARARQERREASIEGGSAVRFALDLDDAVDEGRDGAHVDRDGRGLRGRRRRPCSAVGVFSRRGCGVVVVAEARAERAEEVELGAARLRLERDAQAEGAAAREPVEEVVHEAQQDLDAVHVDEPLDGRELLLPVKLLERRMRRRLVGGHRSVGRRRRRRRVSRGGGPRRGGVVQRPEQPPRTCVSVARDTSAQHTHGLRSEWASCATATHRRGGRRTRRCPRATCIAAPS